MAGAKIYRNGKFTGILERNKKGVFTYTYDEDYLNDPDAMNISVNFPLQEEPFSSNTLFSFFYNMLSEGNVKKAQCRNMKIDESDSFTRLLKTAKNDVIGSVTVEEITDEVS